MHGRRILSGALTVGMVIAPTVAGRVAIGMAVDPAFAQGGHHHSTGHTGTPVNTSVRHRDGSNGSATDGRTVHLRGIITGTPTADSIAITPLTRGENCSTSTPATDTVTIDASTTIATSSNASASWTALNPGDEVTVLWNLPSGTTSTTSIAATSVRDTDTPADVTCAVHGIASTAGTADGVTITTTGTRSRRHREHHRIVTTTSRVSVSVDVTFGAGTTFVQPGNTSFTGADIAQGDRLTIVWTAPRGTALADLPDATKVIDLGPPPPIRYRAVGTAASVGADAGVTLDVTSIRPNIAPKLASSADLGVVFDASTTFSEPGTPAATFNDIQPGDKLVVVWSAPPGTPATSLPDAVRVVNLGQVTTGSY